MEKKEEEELLSAGSLNYPYLRLVYVFGASLTVLYSHRNLVVAEVLPPPPFFRRGNDVSLAFGDGLLILFFFSWVSTVIFCNCFSKMDY